MLRIVLLVIYSLATLAELVMPREGRKGSSAYGRLEDDQQQNLVHIKRGAITPRIFHYVRGLFWSRGGSA